MLQQKLFEKKRRESSLFYMFYIHEAPIEYTYLYFMNIL